MRLTAEQKDSLTELLNIGYARAAASLSDLTGHRVTLAVPDVSVHPVDRITPLLQEVVDGEVTCVNQMFGGPICGNAMLLFDKPAALILTQLLTNLPNTGSLDNTAREVVTEVGNILLNACLGSFGNLMQMNIKFTVPELKVNQVQELLQSYRISNQTFEAALMIRTRFDIRASNIIGFLVILLGVTSLKRVLEGLGQWEASSDQ
jgi:chemotaxis protein CheC